MIHNIEPALLRGAVDVLVIGAGGTGSHILTGLSQLHHAMLALGHPGGLSVTVMDADTVSATNVGRQMFFASDIGKNKAEVLVNRINMAMGVNWTALPVRFEGECNQRTRLIIGCVDNRSSRKLIANLDSRTPVYWLDMGNAQHGGQVILGQVGRGKVLPHVGDLNPDAINADLDEKDETPSCSMAEALEKQSLFINRAMALYGLNLLSDLFRYGKIDYHGVFVNLKTARTNSIKIDPEVWKRMGYPALPAEEKAA